MGNSIKNIRSFILSQKEYFESKGIDVATVRRKYRREEGMSVNRKDITEALIDMRKDGVLKTNWSTQKMGFAD